MAGKYLFKQVRILDPASSKNGKKLDIYVENGVIRKIGKSIQQKATTVTIKGAYALPGFCDLYADFCDPGFEHREDIDSGMKAAAAGGFTTVCIIPHTHPVVQSKSAVEYILHRSSGKSVEVLPLGAVSEDLKGSQPTEMYDMHKAGAIGFTDAPNSVKSSGMLLRALQYVQPFNGIVLDMATDESLSNDGHVSEGEVSVRMGLKGVPHMAEVIQLQRNIEILRYAGGRLHVYGLSTKKGVELIKKAKADGLEISASVFLHHLVFTDEDMRNFDSNKKSNPPFRHRSDRTALLKGLRDGVIDCVSTQHTPLEVEEKKLEFEYASPGMTGLETTWPILAAVFKGKVSEDQFAEWLSINPRKILGLETASIEVGAKANFTLVDPSEEWRYDSSNRKSRSANSPFYKEKLKGRVKGVFNNNKWTINE